MLYERSADPSADVSRFDEQCFQFVDTVRHLFDGIEAENLIFIDCDETLIVF